MQGMYVLMVMTVLLGWYHSQGAGPQPAAADNAAAAFTARQMLQIAGALDHARVPGSSVAALCPASRPVADLPVAGLDNTAARCTEHEGRVMVWAPESPGLATALRRQSRHSALLARVSGGQVTTLSGSRWHISLPAAVTSGSLVYIN